MSELKALEKIRDWVRCVHGVERVNSTKTCANLNANAIEHANALFNDLEAEIASDYMRLPTDADGVPIHVGDEITLPNGSRDKVRFITIREHDVVFNERGWVPNRCTHVKPRTLEDVLVDMLEAAVGYSDAHTDVALVAVESYADEIRELLSKAGD